MAIITHSVDNSNLVAQANLPDQFVSELEKQSNDYIKRTMDYFEIVATSQIQSHKAEGGFVHNYNLVKGILRKEDFFLKDDSPTASFVDTLLKGADLPDHVQHYSILNPPLNTMIGELSKRPDYTRVKAFDADSQNEELEFKTDKLHAYVMQQAKEKILMKLAQQGQEIPEEEVEKLTLEDVEDDLINYTSMAERWANRILTASKLEFNLKELSEEGFRDLLIAGREFFHIYEDNTKLGYGCEILNPADVWKMNSKDKKYTSDGAGRSGGAYAVGIARTMEISEIIQRFPWLPKKEIDHLRKYQTQFPHLNTRTSNLFLPGTGQNTIKYDTYSPYIEQERMKAVGSLGDTGAIEDFLGSHPLLSSYDNRFVVIESYHLSKIKVGKVVFIDNQGEERTIFVDESYQPIPTQIGEVEWAWENQWMKGLKIGHEIYHLEPFTLLDYCPIIGFVQDIKNVSIPRSFIDMLKHFQTIYNVCVNQIFKLLEKEYGNQLVASIRQIPIPKDGDGQDALDIAEMEMKNRSILYIDDSPENLKGAQSFQFRNIDLTKSNEISNRWQLAQTIKNEAWELVGITRARTGSVAATQTATGTQTEMSQSYAQTEPYFAQHEYHMNQVYQALLDAAQYIETQKPESTVSYINNDGEQAFIRLNASDLSDLRMRDLKVWVTSRSEDQRMFEEMRQLAGAMLQNGASMFDVSVLYTTNSIRQMKDIFKKLKEEQQQFAQRQQDIEAGQLQQQQEAIQIQIEADAEQAEMDRQNENYNKQLDRLSKERIAIISATGYGQVASEDLDQDAVPDVLEASRLAFDHQLATSDKQFKTRELQQRERELLQKNDIEREKLQVARENMKNDKEIAKINAKAKKQNKPKSSKK